MPAVAVRPLICGHLRPAGWSMDVRMPVPAFLVEHPDGLVLVDTGLHPAVARDPVARLGARLAGDWPVEPGTARSVAAGLAAIGVDPAALALVVLTHLHFDHAGGLDLVAGPRVLVQRAEWDAAHDPAGVVANGYVEADYDRVAAPLLVEGDHDVFGDGTVVCLATPGHSPGHQSLLLALADGPLLLAADACFFERWLDEDDPPTTGPDGDAERHSLERVRDLRDAGVAVLAGHDPVAWRRLAPAPALLSAAALTRG